MTIRLDFAALVLQLGYPVSTLKGLEPGDKLEVLLRYSRDAVVVHDRKIQRWEKKFEHSLSATTALVFPLNGSREVRNIQCTRTS